MGARHIGVEELLAIYGEAIDEGTLRVVHSECSGIAGECFFQLSGITGIDAPQDSMADGSNGMGSQCASGMLGLDYEDALPTEEEKAKLECEKELNDLMKRKVEDVSKLYEQDRAFDMDAKEQRKLGPQSCRGVQIDFDAQPGDAHAKQCFREMIDREAEHCGEFVCFYHSYSYIALMYEVQACVARVLYGLPDDFAPTARLMKRPFFGRPHVKALLNDFHLMDDQDHNPGFREVAISCSVSLLSPSSEAPPTQCFTDGYSQTDLCFNADDVDQRAGLYRCRR